MKISGSLLGSVVALALASSLVACAAPAAEEAASGGQAQSANGSFDAAAVVGTWELSSGSTSATLTVKSASPIVFDLSVLAERTGHTGDLEAVRARIDGGWAKWSDGDDCTIAFRPSGEKLEVEQSGGCMGTFGTGVFASGLYAKKATGFTAASVGKYEATSPAYEGSITIASISPFRFDLDVVKNSNGHTGQLEGAKATVEGGKAIYSDGSCTLSIAPSGADAIAVEQEGECSDFGASVFVAGTYKKAR